MTYIEACPTCGGPALADHVCADEFMRNEDARLVLALCYVANKPEVTVDLDKFAALLARFFRWTPARLAQALIRLRDKGLVSVDDTKITAVLRRGS